MKDPLKSAKVNLSTIKLVEELKHTEFGDGMSQPRIIKEAVKQLYKKQMKNRALDSLSNEIKNK